MNYYKKYFKYKLKYIKLKKSFNMNGGDNSLKIKKQYKNYNILQLKNNDKHLIYKRYINIIKNILYSVNIDSNIFIKEIDKIIDTNKKNTDEEFYYKLNKVYKNISLNNKKIKIFNRSSARSNQLLKFLNIVKKDNIKTYLDFGGGDGSLSYSIKHTLKLNDKDVYISDIKEYDTIKDYKLNFIENKNGIIDLPDNKFDLITVYMVLHHLKDDILEKTIKTLYRLLKPNGILVLREHNLYFKDNYQKKYIIDLLDIMHDIYDYVLVRKLNWKDKGEYYSKYKSKKEWNNLFLKNKFKIVYDPKFNNILEKNPNLKYNIIYKKMY